MLRDDVIELVSREFEAEMDNPFRTSPDVMVFRHKDTKKWFGIIMTVNRKVLNLNESNPAMHENPWEFDSMPYEDEFIDIMNVKADPVMMDILLNEPGYLPAYHMNKKHWMTIVLDGTVPMDHIRNLLDVSFAMTASKKTKEKSTRIGPREWLIPANPKMYDVVSAFEQNKVIRWKQSSDVRVGDLLYMYVAAPYSSVMYKVQAVEVNIYERRASDGVMRRLMRIELLQKYEPGVFSLEVLREFGVYSVRGPRSIPNSLKCEIDMHD